jgi:hypothetical protein
MKRISLVFGVASAAAIVLALSACAPATKVSLPSSSPHRTHGPVVVHPAKQAAIPSVRVPVKCSALFTDALVAGLIDAPVKVHVDETTAPVDIVDIAPRQNGTLDCVWGGDRQDSGYTESLTIDVTPDGAAGYAANLAGLSAENAPVTSNTAGDKSVYGCVVESAISCVGNMVVGSYWVTANILELSNPSATPAIANSRIQQVLTTVATALKTAKAGPAWTPPGAALPGFCSAAGSTAQVNTALGVSDFALVGEDEGTADAASYTQLPGVYSQCTWQSAGGASPFTYAAIAMLRGGAWVLPSLPGKLNTRAYMLGAYTAMTIPGATAAAGNCSTDADECLVALTIGSVLVVVNMDDPSTAQSTAALTKLVAAIKAS